MDMLKLKNGSEEAAPLVKVTWMSTMDLLEDNPIALVELVSLCRDRDHELFGNTAVKLQDLGLVDPGGKVHGSIRNIVLSSVEGEGLEMRLISPIAEADEKIETMTKNCRVRWRAPDGTTGHAAKWDTRAVIESIVRANTMHEKARGFSATQRYTYEVETRGDE